MKQKIYVPKLRKKVRSAYKAALEDDLLLNSKHGAEYREYMIKHYREGIRHIGRLVDENDCFTSTSAMAEVSCALVYHSASLGLLSVMRPELSILIDDIDTAAAASKEIKQ